MVRITSVANPRVKELVRLQRSGAVRREAGVFCIERGRELERAVAAGFEVAEIFIEPARLRDPAVIDAAGRGGAEVVEVSDAVLEKIAVQENPQGFVAVVRAKRRRLSELRSGGLYLVCSGLEKPGNVGAILRSADAAGADGVLIDTESFDLFNPQVVRNSTGVVFSLTIVCERREAILDGLKKGGVKIVAATPEAGMCYTDAPLTGPVAIVVGAEAQGLDTAWKSAADLNVAIPMRGAADSLNVSVTAALLLFEAARQRRA